MTYAYSVRDTIYFHQSRTVVEAHRKIVIDESQAEGFDYIKPVEEGGIVTAVYVPTEEQFLYPHPEEDIYEIDPQKIPGLWDPPV